MSIWYLSQVLRPYQIELIDKARAAMQRGCKSMILTSPTGSGKTLLTAHMLKTAASRGVRSLFIVHRRELIKQSMRAFTDVGVDFGVIAAGFYEQSAPMVQIASVGSLARRLPRLKKPGLVVWDESHHLGAKSWASIRASLPGAYHIGLTATPCRTDGKGLGKYFEELIHGPSVEWLIENGFLSKYRLFAPPTQSLQSVRTRMGDFVKSELAAIVDKPTITGDTISHYKKHAAGKRAIVFAVSIEHSKHIVAQFQAAGVSAQHVDGETPSHDRDHALSEFKAGNTRILCNVDLFGEGLDVEAIEAVILLRPTHSLGLHLQQLGRGLRPFPGKDVTTILDHAGNTERHGLPDEHREWGLEGIDRTKRDAASQGPAIRSCPNCFAAARSAATVCAHCGHVFEIQAREVQEAEGELEEIDPEEIKRRRKREQGQAQTLEDLIALGKARGYRNPVAWAGHLIAARQRK